MAAVIKGGLKEPPVKWKVREQLILASAVQRSGDQNWVSVSRSVKPFADEIRSPEFYSQKNCATQYSALLDKAGTPRRKRKEDGSQEAVETVEEQIVRHLTSKRIKELDRNITKIKEQYMNMKKELELIEKGEMDDKLQQLLTADDKDTSIVGVATSDQPPQPPIVKSTSSPAHTPPVIISISSPVHIATPTSVSSSPAYVAPPTSTTSPTHPNDDHHNDDHHNDDQIKNTIVPLDDTSNHAHNGCSQEIEKAGSCDGNLDGDKAMPNIETEKKESEAVDNIEVSPQPMEEEPVTIATTDEGSKDQVLVEERTSSLKESVIEPSDTDPVVIEGSQPSSTEPPTIVEITPTKNIATPSTSPTPVPIKEEVELEVVEAKVEKMSRKKSRRKLMNPVKMPQTDDNKRDMVNDPESETEDEYRNESEDEDYEEDMVSPRALPRRMSGRRGARKRDVSWDSNKESPLLKSAKSKRGGRLDDGSPVPPTTRRGRGRRGRGRVKMESFSKPDESDDDIIVSAPASPSTPHGDNESESSQAMRTWRKTIMLVWRHASQHKYANLFLHPVREEDAPGYHDVILRPMDLSTIKKNIETGVIHTDVEFQRDMMLMFQNALMYNSSDHDVYKMAEEMRNDIVEHIQEYLMTQLMVQSTSSKALRSRDTGGNKYLMEDSIKKGRVKTIKQEQHTDD